jgi:TolB-like protein
MPEGAEEDAQSQPAIGSPSIADAKVFISYASQDKAVADTIVATLEHAGIACWIAPRDVIAGAFYADAIVHAIDSATSLVLILSKNGAHSHHVLRELERAASKRRTVITLKIDTEPLPAAFEYFLNTSQWLDASGDHPERQFPKLIEAIRGVRADAPCIVESTKSIEAPTYLMRKATAGALAIVIATGIVYVLVEKPWHWNERAHPQPASSNPTLSAPPPPPPAAFAPPPHSIAVLPFVNMSGDPKQEYFSDGVTEELLNSLSRLSELQVVARTSSFSFKGQNVNVSTIAHTLNAGAILEGSVRRAGNTVRITVQLIDAVTGFHVWSQTYDRPLGDILKVQTDVATAVAQQLELKLSEAEADKIGQGGTRNPQAFDAYLRGMQILTNWDKGERDLRSSLAAFDRAISLDPHYAAAHAQRARTLDYISIFVARSANRAEVRAQAREAAERAVALAPEYGEARIELAQVLAYAQLDFRGAAPEFERAQVLAPGSARVQAAFAGFASNLGHVDQAERAARYAVRLDPQNPNTHVVLASVLRDARRYDEALLNYQDAKALSPNAHYVEANITDVLLASGQFERASQECELPSTPLDEDDRHICLAVAYHALGRQTDAQRELVACQVLDGDSAALVYAGVYAQWGDTRSALQWMLKGERLRDPMFQVLKVWWQLDPIRRDPQFKALAARMGFPP